MKYIILFLFATMAHSDIYIQRVTSEQTGNGYIFAFPKDGVMYCWAMGDVIDLTFIPPTWTPVTQAAIDYRWPVADPETALQCDAGVPRTSGGWLYTISPTMQVVKLIQVPAGIPCGDMIIKFGIFRAVTHNGQVGFAMCK